MVAKVFTGQNLCSRLFELRLLVALSFLRAVFMKFCASPSPGRAALYSGARCGISADSAGLCRLVSIQLVVDSPRMPP